MRIALVAIGRRENLYAVEFVEHYKKIGFDNIFILDNNHDGEEHFEEVLQPYVDDDFVKIIDYRNQVNCQMRAYTEAYEKINKEYDWIAFYDFDEFLLVNGMDVKDWLSRFPDDCQEVLVNWMCMTDSNLVHYDDRPLMDRFRTPMPFDRPVQYIRKDAKHEGILPGDSSADDHFIHLSAGLQELFHDHPCAIGIGLNQGPVDLLRLRSQRETGQNA